MVNDRKIIFGGMLNQIRMLFFMFYFISLIVVCFADIPFFETNLFKTIVGEYSIKDIVGGTLGFNLYNETSVTMNLILALLFGVAICIISKIFERIFIRYNKDWKYKSPLMFGNSIFFYLMVIISTTVFLDFARKFVIKEGDYWSVSVKYYTYRMSLGSGAKLLIASETLLIIFNVVHTILIFLYAKGVVSEKVFTFGMNLTNIFTGQVEERSVEDNCEADDIKQQPKASKSNAVSRDNFKQQEINSGVKTSENADVKKELSTLKRKLIELNELKEEGLINEEDYQTKKSELLKKYD